MRLGQGRDNAKQFLKDHPEVSDEIEKIVRANSDRLLAAGKKGPSAAGPEWSSSPRPPLSPCRSRRQDHRQ